MKQVGIIIMFLIIFLNVKSQTSLPIHASDSTHVVLSRNESGAPTFISFYQGSKVNHGNFMLEMDNEFLFRSSMDSLVLIKATNDVHGFTHYRYLQKYKDIPVFGAEYIIHEKDNIATSANGTFISNINVDITPTVNKYDAIQSARKLIGLKQYRWENTAGIPDTTSVNYPRPQLVIAPMDGNYNTGKICLCWKFNVAANTLHEAWTVFIDAHDGNMVNKISLVTNDIQGITQTLYNGNNYIQCKYDAPSGYYLLAEDQRGSFSNQQIYTCTANNSTIPQVWSTFQYIGNTTATFYDPIAGNIHWGIEHAYDFYEILGRHGFDDNNTYILNLAHYDIAMNNAFWNGYDTVMCYGDGDGTSYGPVVGLDVAGHEFSHAVTQYSAGLIYQSESGALNESFSDIFGTGIEWYVLGANSNWLIGENVILQPPYYLRSMSNPSSGNQPDTYFGINWAPSAPTDPDNGGVHANSGVQNYWFYLLAHGGSGINDYGDSYSVTGIGMSDAINICYRNLTTYLIPSSGYIDAMNGSIQSAIDYWGAGSQQEQSTRSAWCAVGLGNNCITTGIADSLYGPEFSIFPNPSSGIMSIFYDHYVPNDRITICNAMGQVVYQAEINSPWMKIDLSEQPNGIYFASINSTNGSSTKRIAISR